MEYPTDSVQFPVHSPFLLLNFLMVTNWDLVTSFTSSLGSWCNSSGSGHVCSLRAAGFVHSASLTSFFFAESWGRCCRNNDKLSDHPPLPSGCRSPFTKRIVSFWLCTWSLTARRLVILESLPTAGATLSSKVKMKWETQHLSPNL